MLSGINFFNEQKGKGFFFILGFSTTAAITGHVEKGRWNTQVGKHSPNAVQEWRRKGINNYGAAHTRRLHNFLQEAYCGHRLLCPWAASKGSTLWFTTRTNSCHKTLPLKRTSTNFLTHPIRHTEWCVHWESFCLNFSVKCNDHRNTKFPENSKTVPSVVKSCSTKNHEQGAAVNPLWKLGQTLLF